MTSVEFTSWFKGFIDAIPRLECMTYGQFSTVKENLKKVVDEPNYPVYYPPYTPYVVPYTPSFPNYNEIRCQITPLDAGPISVTTTYNAK